jgi:hypothetical protein
MSMEPDERKPMATEQDRQGERDRMGNDPIRPSREQLEEENPVDGPAEVDNSDTGDDDREKAASDEAKEREEQALRSGEELPG